MRPPSSQARLRQGSRHASMGVTSKRKECKAMSISDPSNRHLGTFAEGENEPDAHPEEAHVGTFAEGEAEPEAHPEEGHVGTFAEGEADREDYPEEAHVGTFAKGEEQTAE